jgi:hypothetical protein
MFFSNRMWEKGRGQGMDGMAWKEIQMHVLHRRRRTANGVGEKVRGMDRSDLGLNSRMVELYLRNSTEQNTRSKATVR